MRCEWLRTITKWPIVNFPNTVTKCLIFILVLIEPQPANSLKLKRCSWSWFSWERFLCRPHISFQSSVRKQIEFTLYSLSLFQSLLLFLSCFKNGRSWLPTLNSCSVPHFFQHYCQSLAAQHHVIELANSETRWHLGISTLTWRERGCKRQVKCLEQCFHEQWVLSRRPAPMFS